MRTGRRTEDRGRVLLQSLSQRQDWRHHSQASMYYSQIVSLSSIK